MVKNIKKRGGLVLTFVKGINEMDMNSKKVTEFLTWTEEMYGSQMRDECQKILVPMEGDDFAPLAIVHDANYILHKDEIDAAIAMGNVPFDSD